MSKYVLPPKSWYGLGEVREPRQVFDTLEEAAAAYKSGLLGPMLEWKGPFSGPFPLCREWHGHSNAVVTGMGPWPPECIYEIDVETTQEAKLLYDQWLSLAKKAAEERKAAEMPSLKRKKPLVIKGKAVIHDDGEFLGISVKKTDLIGGIIDAFLEVPDPNRLDGFTFGPVRITVELLDAP